MIDPSAKEKSFILIIPNDFGIYEMFNHNIEKFGFQLTYCLPQEFKYRKFSDRAKNLFRKTFLKDKRYKRKLIRQFNSELVQETIQDLAAKSIDYILVIRPDTINTETVERLLKVGKKVIGYQWDGLERFDDIFQYINYFEKFLVFDKNDFAKYKTKYPNLVRCDNFYFDYDDESPNCEKSNMVYYIGSYIEDRTADLVEIVHELEKNDVNLDINLKYFPSTLPINEKNIKFFKHTINFRENLTQMKKAKVLLDFKVCEHDGLSLRFFEALKYSKKIITNNAAVKDYDFYDSQNIFIMHHDDYSNLPEFLSSDYKAISQEIVDHYAFSSWLNRYVL